MKCVALVTPTASAGGSERALASLARELPAAGYRPIAVLLEHGPLEEWLGNADCQVVSVQADRTRYLHKTARTVGRISSVIRRTGAHVVLSNQSKGHVLGGSAALLARRPSVWWQQGIPGPSAIEIIAGRVPTAAVVCASDAAVAAQRRITPNRTILKIHPGTDVDSISAHRGCGAGIRRSLGWDGRRVVGIVGRLEPWKGQAVFLRAAAALSDTHPDVRFVVVGGAVHGREGSYPEDLRVLASRLGISEKVYFSGHRLDVWDWCDAMDVVVHASSGEPFGLVVVESMALGKPVIAAADAGPLEIVENGVSGLLTKPGDHQELAQALRRLLDDPVFAAALAREAAVRAGAFSSERMGRELAAVLDGVIASRSGARHAS